MKSSSTYIKESASFSDYYVRFVKVKGDAGIMFEGKMVNMNLMMSNQFVKL